MNPVNPRPTLGRVDRARRAKDHHRHAVAERVEDAHRAMHQPDVAVQHDRHRFPRRFGVAMRDGYCVILMQTQDHLRIAIAQEVDEAVVKTAKAGARI